MKTTINFNNYLEQDGILYIGIPKTSSENELDALVSLLMNKIEVEHNGRQLKKVSMN